jgi:hypothetical protein
MRCAGCGGVLVPVFPKEITGEETTTQFDGAVTVTIEGGYGKYYDGVPITLSLCRDCTHMLQVIIPDLRERMLEAEKELWGE